MPDYSAEVRALLEKGCLRIADIAPILGVSVQRVGQIVAEREDFPKPAKVFGWHRLWRRKGRGTVAGRAASGVGLRMKNDRGDPAVVICLERLGAPHKEEHDSDHERDDDDRADQSHIESRKHMNLLRFDTGVPPDFAR